MLKDYRLPAKGAAKSLAIFLHGYGDHGGGGLMSICQMWQQALPDCEFLCPDAPQPFEHAPEMGRQWFGLMEYTKAKIEEGVMAAAPVLNAYIDQALAERNLPPSRLVLAGFSQGSMMALYTAPRRAEPVAGVIGYSGMLCCGAALATEKRSAPPVLLAHGTDDEVVPYAALADAERRLKQAGIPVESISRRGLGHGIDEQGIAAGLAFLKTHLAA